MTIYVCTNCNPYAYSLSSEMVWESPSLLFLEHNYHKIWLSRSCKDQYQQRRPLSSFPRMARLWQKLSRRQPPQLYSFLALAWCILEFGLSRLQLLHQYRQGPSRYPDHISRLVLLMVGEVQSMLQFHLFDQSCLSEALLVFECPPIVSLHDPEFDKKKYPYP